MKTHVKRLIKRHVESHTERHTKTHAMLHTPSMMRYLAALAVLVALAASHHTWAATADHDTPDGPGRDLETRKAIVAAMSTEIRRPPHWTERNAFVRFFARLISSNPEPHLRAIWEIAKTELPSAADPLREVLLDRDSPYRVDAAIALNRSPNEAAVEALTEVLDDPDPTLRHVSARVLGFIVEGDDVELDPRIERRVEQRLARLLREDPEPRVRVAALHGLAQIGSDSSLAAAYEIGVRDDDDLVRCGVAMRTGDFMSAGSGSGIDPNAIRRFLRDSSRSNDDPSPLGLFERAWYRDRYYTVIGMHTDCIDVHEMALEQLAKMRDPAALPALLRAAADPDAGLRATAVASLARYRHPKALAAVVAALGDSKSGVRHAAIEGLGASAMRDADRHLAEVLRSGRPFDRRAAAAALGGSFGASSSLIEAFADSAVQVRNEAEDALLRSNELVLKIDEALARARSAALPSQTEEQRQLRIRKIEEGLEEWRNERREAEQALALGLASSDIRVRIRSARVLAMFQSPESFTLLIESLRSGRHPQSEMAALSLGLRGDVAARSDLEVAAGSDDEVLSIAAIRALNDLGDPGSLKSLRSIEARTQSEAVGAAAQYAIAMLKREQARVRRGAQAPR